MNAMAETTTHNQVITEIKASLNHLLYSLTNFSQVTPHIQPISKPAPVLSLPLLPLSNLTAHHIPKPTPPAQYPIKYLTYSEMQTRRDHGLCLDCNERDAPAHYCQTKRILLVLPDEDYLDLRSHPLVLTKLADQELNNEQEISSPTLTGATNPISSNTISNDDPKLLYDKEIFFPNTLEVVLEIDPFHVYFTKIKDDDLNHAKTAFDIVFSVGCCLTVGFCNAFISSFLQKIRVADAHNLFFKMIEPYFVMTIVSKPLIFDPGGTFAIEFTFEAWSVHYNLHATLNMISQQAQIQDQARNLAKLHILTTLRTRSSLKGRALIRTHARTAP